MLPRSLGIHYSSKLNIILSTGMTYTLIILGLILLLCGGEAVVGGHQSLAQRLGVSPLIVGLTIVGFGTSLPEMVVSVNAALIGAPGLVVGNVIGSNIANILLIPGVAALIAPFLSIRLPSKETRLS